MLQKLKILIKVNIWWNESESKIKIEFEIKENEY